MKCVVTDYVEPDLTWETEQYRAAGIEFEAMQLRGASENDLKQVVGDAHVLVVDQAKITETVLEEAGKCVLVIRHGDGYDNVDIDAATRLGIAVANKPGFWTEEVAEQALTLLLAVWSKLTVQTAVAGAAAPGAQFPWDLKRVYPVRRFRGSTVGVVGFGRIGRQVAAKVQSLGATVVVSDPLLEPETIVEAGARPVAYEELLETADAVSFHVPGTEKTHRLLNEDALNRMKPHAVVVNTARGSVVETEALVQALRDGRIAGAALDVTDPEPLPADHPLFGLDNVVVTPHLGWYSDDSMWAMRTSIVGDVKQAAQGQLPDSVVNPQVLNSSGFRMAR